MIFFFFLELSPFFLGSCYLLMVLVVVLILQCLVINVQRNFCSCWVGVVHVPSVTLCWSYLCCFVIMINRLCCWSLFTWLVGEIVSCACRILKPGLNHELNFVLARSNAESINDDQPKVEKLSLKKKGIGSEVRAERLANADSDLQLLGETERGRLLQKQKKRRFQGREDDVCYMILVYTFVLTLLSGMFSSYPVWGWKKIELIDHVWLSK